MKKVTLLLFVSLSIILMSMLSCSGTADSTSDSEEGGGEALKFPRISDTAAATMINMYINIYGDEGVKVFSNPNCKDTCTGLKYEVLLPKYFVVNSDSFQNLLHNTEATGKLLFASFGVKMRKDGSHEKDTAVTDLIFHQVRPDKFGTLKDTAKDIFLDYGNACPIDCGDSYAHGGYNGGGITKKQAYKRIDCFDCIYYGDSSPDGFFYLVSESGKDSVLIARYFAFVSNDIKQLLKSMKSRHHEFFYVSIGAKPDTANGKPIDGTYVSDLIFHYVRPKKNGRPADPSYVAKSEEDENFDVTVPCPKVCP